MDKAAMIVVERVDNGFIVRPFVRANECIPSEMYVFNDLGYSSQMRDDSNVPSLLVFLQDHFGSAR